MNPKDVGGSNYIPWKIVQSRNQRVENWQRLFQCLACTMGCIVVLLTKENGRLAYHVCCFCCC